MARAAVIKGHRVADDMVRLDRPLPAGAAEVDVVLRLSNGAPASAPPNLADFLRSLPPGTRTKTDIDEQVRDERASWPE